MCVYKFQQKKTWILIWSRPSPSFIKDKRLWVPLVITWCFDLLFTFAFPFIPMIKLKLLASFLCTFNRYLVLQYSLTFAWQLQASEGLILRHILDIEVSYDNAATEELSTLISLSLSINTTNVLIFKGCRTINLVCIWMRSLGNDSYCSVEMRPCHLPRLLDSFLLPVWQWWWQ